MSKKMKLWLLIATSAIVVGCVVFTVVMSMLGWDFSKLSTFQYETNTYVISEEFQNIWIDTNTADVVFLPSKDGTTKVVCYEREKIHHNVTVEEDTLVILEVSTTNWTDNIGINFNQPKITVYLPKEEYCKISVKTMTGDVNCTVSASGELKLYTTTGDIVVENLCAGALELAVTTGKVTVVGVTCENDARINVSTGDVRMVDVRCKNLASDGRTGDTVLDNVVATGRFDIERDTGDVRLDHCDAKELFIETDTGDVTGSLLSEKVFIAETDTGRVNVPKTTTGGRCEISTDTGDIKITIVNE